MLQTQTLNCQYPKEVALWTPSIRHTHPPQKEEEEAEEAEEEEEEENNQTNQYFVVPLWLRKEELHPKQNAKQVPKSKKTKNKKKGTKKQTTVVSGFGSELGGLDQPNSALDQYGRAAEKFPGETHILVGLARTGKLRKDKSNKICLGLAPVWFGLVCFSCWQEGRGKHGWNQALASG